MSEHDEREALKWVRRGDDCEWCGVDVGPHEHSVREDGTLGNLVRPIPEPSP